MVTTAIIVAAGRGARMGGDLPKQFLQVAGRSVLFYSIMAFERCNEIDHIILVVPRGYVEHVQEKIVERHSFSKITCIVPGGDQRQDSVRNGLAVLPPHTALVAIHDGVRPCISPHLIRTVVQGAKHFGAAIPCVAVRDTVKRVQGDIITETIDRVDLVAVQTPQVFTSELIIDAYRHAYAENIIATDDAGLVERLGKAVHAIGGDPNNVKITAPEDIAYFGWLVQEGKWVLA